MMMLSTQSLARHSRCCLVKAAYSPNMEQQRLQLDHGMEMRTAAAQL